MPRYETTVVLCRKSDRQLIQVHVNLPRGAVIDKFLRAKLGMDNGVMSLGVWNANLDEYLVMGITDTKMWV